MNWLSSIIYKPRIALCFIISYDHILKKEAIWREWIEQNKDIINVYFFYKDKSKIKSPWILSHLIDEEYIVSTSYLQVVPAYMNIIHFAYKKDHRNQWFCLLTDSCCPIISPRRFRYLFFKNYQTSIMSWRAAWWNPIYHKRANLISLPLDLHLGNSPWFVLNRSDVLLCIRFLKEHNKLFHLINEGGLANESIFAIIFKIYNRLSFICREDTHLTDWSRMSSTTSPYVFKEDNELNRKFINESLKQNKMALFIRKMEESFPDETLRYYIYEYDKKNNLDLKWIERYSMRQNWDWVIGLLIWLIGVIGLMFYLLILMS